jgi:hypothetical protein
MSKVDGRIDREPTHVCKVTATVIVPGTNSVQLTPGRRVNLDAVLAHGITLRDSVKEQWFEVIESEQPAPVAEESEE